MDSSVGRFLFGRFFLDEWKNFGADTGKKSCIRAVALKHGHDEFGVCELLFWQPHADWQRLGEWHYCGFA